MRSNVCRPKEKSWHWTRTIFATTAYGQYLKWFKISVNSVLKAVNTHKT